VGRADNGHVQPAEAERGVTSVLERERELERIGAAMADAMRNAGGVLLLEGPAGIGKSTLANAAAQEGRSRGMRVLRAAGRELERDFPYGVVRQLVDPVLRTLDAPEREQLLDGAGAAVAALQLTLAPEDGQSGSEFSTLHGLYWLLANLSDQGPLLLVVDDSHWADVASLRFLAFLAPRLVELPALLLLCARPNEWKPETWFAATASDVAIQPLVLAPLTREGCRVLVCAEFDEPVDEGFSTACYTATGGNPFLLRALLDELVSDRSVPRTGSVESVLAMGPRSVTRSIVARLGRLSPAARPLAAACAVLGDSASADELAALTRLSAREVRETTIELANASVLALGEGFRFAHPIVRNAVYQSLALAEQDRLHRQAAGLLDQSGAPADRVAAQLLATGPAGDAQVCASLRTAADRALAAGASHSAVTYLRRALAEPCPKDERAELLVELGAAERLVDGQAAIAHLREGLEQVSDNLRYAQIASQLAWVLNYAGRAGEAVATAEQAVLRLGEGERDLRRRLEATIMLAAAQDPSVARARERVVAQLGEVEREPGAGARMVQAALLMGELRPGVPTPQLAPRAERLLSDGLLLSEEAYYLFLGLVLLLIEAESEAAIVWLDRGVERARQEGNGLALAANLHFSCMAHLRRGELSDAVLDGTEGLVAAERWGATAGIPWCAGNLARAQIETGDLDGAERTLARVAPPSGQVPDQIGWDVLLRTRAILRMARGDPRECADLTLEAVRRFEPRSRRWIGWRSRIALCLTASGAERERAVALADEDVQLARVSASLGALGEVLRTRGVVLGNEAGEESLREAVAVLEASTAKLERAQALVELGAMLRRKGRRREAREPLRGGLELARICGAGPLAERAEDELRATGASPRNLIRVGVDSLTTSERRVCQMATSGMSNKQIAQALFVTVKTVETHLSRSYQKLDVTSRAKLAAAFRPRP
jgi:DNA-binding CsgD family transcriptional regulator/tetratricopeptide (TPR) repeat protein